MPRRTRKHLPPFDLFGEVPVTVDELGAWCEAVPRIPRSSWRFTWYVTSWRVADKIRAAKIAGTFEAIVSSPDPEPPAYQDLARRVRRHELEHA